MGMFDLVYAPCPECKELVKTQSKRGARRLCKYHINSVPIEIAQDLDGKNITCLACNVIFTLRISIALPRVSMTAFTKDNDWD